jgi:ubiquinone biosynthesis protein COQ4
MLNFFAAVLWCRLLLQTGLPMTAMAVAGAQFKLTPEDRQLLWQVYLPWATQTGLRCADLMCLYYEKHFEEDVEELRARWRIVPAPPVPEHLAFKQKP